MPTGNWVIRKPASAGPIARARFMLTAPSAAAARTWWRGTMSGIRACQGGMLIAAPAPSRKVNVSSSAGDRSVVRVEPGEDRAEGEGGQLHPDEEPAAVERVGEHACGQRQQQHRQQARGLHEGHERGGVRFVDQQPLGADGLHPGADHAAELGEPQRPERDDPQRRPRRTLGDDSCDRQATAPPIQHARHMARWPCCYRWAGGHLCTRGGNGRVAAAATGPGGLSVGGYRGLRAACWARARRRVMSRDLWASNTPPTTTVTRLAKPAAGDQVGRTGCLAVPAAGQPAIAEGEVHVGVERLRSCGCREPCHVMQHRHVLVYEAAESVSSQWPNGRCGARGSVA